MSILAAFILSTIAITSCAGCTTTIVPPRTVADPVSVYLVDYGRHPSIVLPRTQSALVEYTFGEWKWYAENETAGLSAARAMMVPTQGALGRRHIECKPHKPWTSDLGYLHVYEITVERDRAAALLAQLDERWEAGAEDARFNEHYDLVFVPDEQEYHFMNNSNPTVARWLEDIGCEVRGSALLSQWRIAEE